MTVIAQLTHYTHTADTQIVRYVHSTHKAKSQPQVTGNNLRNRHGVGGVAETLQIYTHIDNKDHGTKISGEQKMACCPQTAGSGQLVECEPPNPDILSQETAKPTKFAQSASRLICCWLALR